MIIIKLHNNIGKDTAKHIKNDPPNCVRSKISLRLRENLNGKKKYVGSIACDLSLLSILYVFNLFYSTEKRSILGKKLFN